MELQEEKSPSSGFPYRFLIGLHSLSSLDPGEEQDGLMCECQSRPLTSQLWPPDGWMYLGR